MLILCLVSDFEQVPGKFVPVLSGEGKNAGICYPFC